MGELQGYRLLDCEDLIQATSTISCLACASPVKLREDLSIRRGLTLKLSFRYTNAKCEEESKSQNVRSILVMRTIGRGHSGMESFCGMMGMLPLVTPRSSLHTTRILVWSLRKLHWRTCLPPLHIYIPYM